MRLAAGLLLTVALASLSAAVGAQSSDLAGRQSEAESQQAALRDRIGSLQKELDAREAARQEAVDALRQSESAISRINLRLRELAQGNRQAETDLAGLEKQVAAQQVALQQRRAELASQLRTQYTSGLSPWTALLSGDDPQQLGRNLGYLGYVSRARARTVQALRLDIDRLAVLQTQADARRADLQKLVVETAAQKAELVKQQKERATLLARLEGQIAAQRVEARQLGRDDQRLSRLIDDLDGAIARQAEQARRVEEARQRADALRRAQEAHRAEQAQHEEAVRREAEAQAQRQAADAERRRTEARDAEQVREQVEVAARRPSGPVALADPDAAGLRPVDPESMRVVPPESFQPAARDAEKEDKPTSTSTAAARRSAPGSSNGLRHGLPTPVRGTVQGRFGVSRPDGGVWRGIVLRAPEGAPVKVVASGTVVYADWLRGFGNLIIVDHGQQYLTVYAYNQSVLKRVGDRVSAGDTIAMVGATGGQVESGLYFEIRYRGAPVDPALWLAQ